jgi:xanthine dehydrogenase accessory factor
MLATIVWASGSTPAPTQSKMLLDYEGSRIAGTIGGGCVEDAIMRRCAALEDKRRAIIMDFELNDDEAESGLICGGNLKVLLEPISNTQLNIYNTLVDRFDAGLASVVVTEIDFIGTIKKYLLDHEFKVAGGDFNNITFIPKSIFTKFEPAIQKDGNTTNIFEPIEGRSSLFIFGGGHVGRAVAKSANIAGFRVTVVDDRIEFASKDSQPDAEEVICLPFRNISDNINIPSNAYTVIVTRGHRYDELVLDQVIRFKPKYIGMIGSKRKVLVAFQHLIEKGYDEKELDQVFAPVGLDIGAVTVEEIAISITAEMISVKRITPDNSTIKHKKLTN